MLITYFVHCFRVQFIQTSKTNGPQGPGEGVEEGFKMLVENPPPLVSVRDIAEGIMSNVGIRVEDIPLLGKSFVDEIEYFVQTGNVSNKTDKIVCVNPTLLTLEDKLWEVTSP